MTLFFYKMEYMKCVIFAAGKGTRMGEVTRTIPKPLIEICGRPLMGHILDALPTEVGEIVIVTGHLDDVIKDRFGSDFKGRNIEYIGQKEDMPGTGGALWSVKEAVGRERFMVLNGDDIYGSDFLKILAGESFAFGVSDKEWDGYLSVIIDDEGYVKGLENKEGKKNVAVGAYVLDGDIFARELIKGKSGEYNLPRTIMGMADIKKIKAVSTDRWISVNCPEDIKKAEEFLRFSGI